MNQFQQKITIMFVQNFKFFVILTIMVVFGAGYFFFVKQSFFELKEKREKLINMGQNELTAKTKELKELKILKNEYQKLEGLEVQKLIAILPFKKNIPDLFRELENLTQKSGVSLLSLDITEGETIDDINLDENKKIKETIQKIENGTSLSEIKNLKSLNIAMEIGGINYYIFKIFLNNLEKNIRLMDVNSFNFDLNKKSQKIMLKTYYLE
ncbi:MAG: type 4a pilus biogenesis protein PilO [Patescibacteria group bacterium]